MLAANHGAAEAKSPPEIRFAVYAPTPGVNLIALLETRNINGL